MLHDFRWEARYSSTSHDEEVTQARQHLLALEEVQDAKQRIVDNIKQGISKALMEGQAPNPVFTETLKEADAALVEAENAVAIADRKLAALKSKTVGKAAAREARAKLKAFMNSRLDTTQNERGSMSGFTARGWWLWLIQERSEPRSTLQKLSETASLNMG
jgi:hypothetical protein